MLNSVVFQKQLRVLICKKAYELNKKKLEKKFCRIEKNLYLYINKQKHND